MTAAAETVADAGVAQRAENDALFADDLRQRRTRPRSLPPIVRLETTTRCLLRCLHCFKRVPPAGEDRDMSLDLFAALGAELFPRIRIVELTFDGEPLHDPLLRERLNLLPVGGPRIDLLTSAHGLDELVEVLVPRLSRLTISLEALDDELYPMVRRGADLRTLLRTIERFRRCREAVPSGARPVLAFRLTIFHGNHARLPEIVARLVAAGGEEIHLVHGVPAPGGDPDLGPATSSDALAIALQRAALQGATAGVPVHYPRLRPRATGAAPAASPFSPAGGLPSWFPWGHATVDVDGSVSLCCPRRLLRTAASVLLDRNRGFREAWTAVPFQVIRGSSAAAACCGFCPQGQEVPHG